MAWIRKWKPDVIICNRLRALDICRKMKLDVPGDIGVASTMVSLEGDERSGINQLQHAVGTLAVDTVVALLHSNQLGVPENRRTIMLKGSWVDGKATRSGSLR